MHVERGDPEGGKRQNLLTRLPSLFRHPDPQAAGPWWIAVGGEGSMISQRAYPPPEKCEDELEIPETLWPG